MTDTELDDRLAELVAGYKMAAPALVSRAREFKAARGTTLARALLELRLVQPEMLSPLLEELTGVRAVDPSLMTVYPDFVEKMTTLFPPPVIASMMVFPAQAELNAVHVCLLNPTDGWTRAALESMCGCHVVPMVAHESAIASALEQHFKRYLNGARMRAPEADSRAAVDAAYQARIAEPIERLVESAVSLINRNRDAMLRGPQALEALIRDPAIIRLVHQLLCRAIAAGSSDLHFEPLGDRFRVRIRVDGGLRELCVLPAPAALPITSRLKAMADLPFEPVKVPVDGRISYDLIWGREVDFRFSLVPAATGERIVLRALDRARERRSLDDLGFKPDILRTVQASADLPNGILLVTGPTGSGKTTTLYALLDALNDADTCVLTAEDPVESRIDGTGQVPCDEGRGVTFASALRSFLRQDPDVIMVGEIRDAETADIALKAALTGHLVLSTLHTNDAPGAIIRLVNMNLEPFVIASALRLVLAQRLIRRLCSDCKRPDEQAATRLAALHGDAEPGMTVFGPGGCPRCLQSGYRGRIAIHEALAVNSAIEELILTRAPAAAVREAARRAGMRTLRDSALQLVRDGITSLDEALENTIAEEAAA